MHKQVLLFFFCLLSVITGHAQELHPDWIRQFGSSGTSQSRQQIVVSGNYLYSVVLFYNTVDFGGQSFTSNGKADMAISKFDLSGNPVWTKTIGGEEEDYVEGITVDASGNVYVTGSFRRTVDFDPGPAVNNLTATGALSSPQSTDEDIFVLKLSADGDFRWVKSMGSVLADNGYFIKVQGNFVYVTGSFRGEVNFGTGSPDGILTADGGTPPNTSSDIFVAKFDLAGNCIWARRMGGPGSDQPYSLDVDEQGNTYTTGTFTQTASFGSDQLTSLASTDIFITRLDATGNFVWTRGIHGSSFNDFGTSVVLDGAGNLVVTGYFEGDVDFDPSPGGVFMIEGKGYWDVFVLKLTTDGSFVWARSMAGTGNTDEEATCAAIDGSGNIYITGRFENAIDLDPGPAQALFTTRGGRDIFMVKLSPDGDYQWGKTIGGPGSDYASSIAVNNDKVYLTGGFTQTADFDPGATELSRQATGTVDTYIVAYSQQGAPQPAQCPADVTFNNPGEVAAFVSTYSHCTGITGNVTVQGTVENLSGLTFLESIGGDLRFNNAAGLQDISGLSGLKTIGKELYIGNNPLLQNLDALSAVTGIGEEINMVNNTGLTSIEGLKNADLSGVSYLYIQDNGALSVCNLANICAYLATNRQRSISGNLGNCATEAAVQAACNPGGFTLTLAEATGPQTCDGITGAITFITTLPDQNYTLSFKRNSTDTSATVTASNGTFILGGLRTGTYSNFSITYANTAVVAAGQRVLTGPVTPGNPVVADGPLEFCEGESVKLTAPEGESYDWSTGAQTRSIQATAGGIYNVKVRSAQGCVSESQITLTTKECNVPPMAVCKPVVVLVAKDDCYAILRTEDLDAGSYDTNNDWFNRSIDINPALRVGTYTATMTVVDTHGASASCTSQVHVVDHSIPVVKARGLTLELNEQGRAVITVADVDAGSYDNCGPLQLSLNRTEFDCRDLGHLQVILTGTDASGNTSTALADIHVVDNRPPAITTGPVQLVLDGQGKAVLKTGDLVQDNCGIWDITASKTGFDCGDIGENTIKVRVEDVQGAVTEAEVRVIVADTTAPVLKAAPFTVYLDKNGRATAKAAEAGAGSSDNCGLDSLTLSRSEFGCDDTGEQEVILKGRDKSGNETEKIIIITVADTTAPVIETAAITIYLTAEGKATLKEEALGGSDNCGIAGSELERSQFSCTETGEHTVRYTLRDKAGNTTTRAIRVTVKDTIAPVIRAQDLIVELDGSGKASLEADRVNDGSTDNCGITGLSLSQTTFSCSDLGRRLITLTARDGSGNTGTARAEILVHDPEGVCPCSYGVLAEEKVVLRHNEVNAGGVGVSGRKGMVRLRKTVVESFVKSERTRFDNWSASAAYMRGKAPQAEGFRSNDRKDRKKEKIKKGETRRFAAGSYGRIRGGKEAKLVFSGGDVYIRSIRLKKGAEVSFEASTALMIRDKVKLGGTFNREKETVRLYSRGNIRIRGEEVKGYMHSRGTLRTTGGKEKYMEGFFAAESIRGGRHTYWSGGGLLCRDSENRELLAKEKSERKKTANEEAGAEEMKADTLVQAGALQVRLWPNPATAWLQVEISGEADGGEVTLVDLLGNVLRQAGFSGSRETVKLQTGKLAPGLYILRVKSGNGVVTLRVVKEN